MSFESALRVSSPVAYEHEHRIDTTPWPWVKPAEASGAALERSQLGQA